VVKYSGLTVRICATGRTPVLKIGCPSIRNREASRKSLANGSVEIPPADFTPGNPLTC